MVHGTQTQTLTCQRVAPTQADCISVSDGLFGFVPNIYEETIDSVEGADFVTEGTDSTIYLKTPDASDGRYYYKAVDNEVEAEFVDRLNAFIQNSNLETFEESIPRRRLGPPVFALIVLAIFGSLAFILSRAIDHNLQSALSHRDRTPRFEEGLYQPIRLRQNSTVTQQLWFLLSLWLILV
ncbi:MAG: hypothetical protein AAF485_17060, partial [Chloroflexota bacterium]